MHIYPIILLLLNNNTYQLPDMSSSFFILNNESGFVSIITKVVGISKLSNTSRDLVLHFTPISLLVASTIDENVFSRVFFSIIPNR